jgi:hypothetical protein
MLHRLRPGESRDVVDLVAIRKDHGRPIAGTKRGDALQIILIQVKGGSAAMPTIEDGKRLRTGRQALPRSTCAAGGVEERIGGTVFQLDARMQLELDANGQR